MGYATLSELPPFCVRRGDTTKDAVYEQARWLRDDRVGHPISNSFVLRKFGEVAPIMTDPDWSADLLRYGGSRPFLREQSIWALWIYRFGRRTDRRPEGLTKRLLTIWYGVLFRWVETTVGVSLPKSVQVGPGLRIWHFGGIFIHSEVVIGSNCTLRQGVTIGNRHAGGPVPVIGDDVELGAYAQVLGGIRIGNGCKIGAMAVVLCDMPDGATAVGAPAKIILAKDSVL